MKRFLDHLIRFLNHIKLVDEDQTPMLQILGYKEADTHHKICIQDKSAGTAA